MGVWGPTLELSGNKVLIRIIVADVAGVDKHAYGDTTYFVAVRLLLTLSMRGLLSQFLSSSNLAIANLFE
ncbi:MAG: hypothetical protein CL912_29445 [Deltaproteobacteria bacterium]|nr:hypothetical protein [Deltaproteobacteria bacterium]